MITAGSTEDVRKTIMSILLREPDADADARCLLCISDCPSYMHRLHAARQGLLFLFLSRTCHEKIHNKWYILGISTKYDLSDSVRVQSFSKLLSTIFRINLSGIRVVLNVFPTR